MAEALDYGRVYPSGQRPIARAHSDAWYAMRSGGVGSSEVAAILGECEYDDPISVWSRKTGRTPEKASSVQMRKGSLLEELILDLAAEKLRAQHGDASVTVCQETLQDPECDRLFSTPDGIVTIPGDERGPGLVECKYTGLRIWEWQREHQDGPSVSHQLQLQVQLACTGYRWGVVAVLCERTDEPLLFEYEAHPVIESIRGAVTDFWGYVERDERPPVMPTSAALRAVKALYPKDSGAAIDLPDEATEWDRDLAEVKAQIKELEKRKDGLEALVRGAMGDATIGLIPGGGRFKNALVKRAGYVAKASEHRRLTRLVK